MAGWVGAEGDAPLRDQDEALPHMPEVMGQEHPGRRDLKRDVGDGKRAFATRVRLSLPRYART